MLRPIGMTGQKKAPRGLPVALQLRPHLIVPVAAFTKTHSSLLFIVSRADGVGISTRRPAPYTRLLSNQTKKASRLPGKPLC